ncbi:MAG: aldehyde dehydrogenase family protein [Pseudomonadota bacterium]
MTTPMTAESMESSEDVIAGLVGRARAAMEAFDNTNQEAIDEAVTALAWSIYKPENARRLAELAVESTGLGNVEDKVTKNQRKTFGTLRDLMRVKTTGVIEEQPELGLVKYGKPVGVVAAITPSTNPAATPVNKAMMAVKGGNAVIIAPSPAGYAATAATVDGMRAELEKIGAPADLVQIVPAPVDRERTAVLMAAVDLIVCTGSQNNVRKAYSSGTPAIGVGAGNVPVIIDESADLTSAAEKITASKIFDNATSCSSENSVIIVDEVFDAAIDALTRAGGYMTTSEDGRRVVERLWEGGKLNRRVIAKDAAILADVFELPDEAKGVRFIMVEETGVGPAYPLSGEKLSLVLTVYRARDFRHAQELAGDILEFQGKGHSLGLHTNLLERARKLAEEMPVVRVLVNQAHTFANGGGFDTGLPFTLSMGCGSWGGNSITENLNYRHFINVTHLVRSVAEDKPEEADLFGKYWEKHGQ